MALPKRELGRTGLQVTTLGYGAMELRGAPRARDIIEEQAETILNKVLDSGINYIGARRPGSRRPSREQALE
jgi:aryl-alcohol dehydrogenase-like predicted oxidoreductase